MRSAGRRAPIAPAGARVSAVPPTPGTSGPAADLRPTRGWCALEVERELPGLALLSAAASVRRSGSLTGGSPRDIQARLRELSNRMRGATAVAVRRQPVPAAYRVFFRHIGLDPDLVRTPIEAAVLERMLRGGFLSGGLLEDVLRIALIDTGVPVWALAAEAVEGPLGIRSSAPGELLGRSAGAPPLAAGRLVVADAGGPLGSCSARSRPGTRPRPARGA
jgi:DNA/RNA-binding domain of Phe-tRNA-synthetase-like protein